MLRLKDLPPAEMDEVVRVASELYQRDQRAEEDQLERQHVVAAAEEVGLPGEYLELAAAEIHQRRVAETIARSGRKRWKLAAVGIVAGVAAAVAFGVSRTTTSVAPFAAPQTIESFSSEPALRWELNHNPQTQSTVRFTTDEQRGEVALVQVDRLGRSADGKYWANLDMNQGGVDLTARKSVAFDVRGQGLPRVRLYLENGALERWRSPALSVPSGWETRSVPLNQFEYQTRASSTASWSVHRYQPPKQVRQLSFKLGDFVNDVNARGTVALDNVIAE